MPHDSHSNTNSQSFNSTENQNSIGVQGAAVLKKRQRKQDKTRKLPS